MRLLTRIITFITIMSVAYLAPVNAQGPASGAPPAGEVRTDTALETAREKIKRDAVRANDTVEKLQLGKKTALAREVAAAGALKKAQEEVKKLKDDLETGDDAAKANARVKLPDLEKSLPGLKSEADDAAKGLEKINADLAAAEKEAKGLNEALSVLTAPANTPGSHIQNPNTLGNEKIYSASLAALTKLFVVAVLLESGLALLFNWSVFLAYFNRRA